MSDIQLLARLVNCTDLHEISVHVYYRGHAPDHVINFETYSCGSATLLQLCSQHRTVQGGASDFHPKHGHAVRTALARKPVAL